MVTVAPLKNLVPVMLTLVPPAVGPALGEIAVTVGAAASPRTKSLRDVTPVTCVLVDVFVPTVGYVQPASYFPTIKLVVLAPPSMSPAIKLNVAL
jgi:hypothetical protein